MEQIKKEFLTDIVEESAYKGKPITQCISECISLVYQYAENHDLKVDNIVYVPRGMKGDYLIIFKS